MATYKGVEILLHAFLSFELDGGEWSVSCTTLFIPGEKDPGIQWIGGWAGTLSGNEFQLIVANHYTD
jgi:hypothetical protein